MVRLRRPFPSRPEANLRTTDAADSQADNTKRKADSSDDENPATKRQKTSSEGRAATASSPHSQSPGDPLLYGSPEPRNEQDGRLLEHLQAQSAENASAYLPDTTVNAPLEAADTNHVVDSNSSNQNIQVTPLGRTETSGEELHDHHGAVANQSSKATTSDKITIGTPIRSGASTPTDSRQGAGHSAGHPSTTISDATLTDQDSDSDSTSEESSIVVANPRMPPVPVKGTKAARLREYFKHWPKPPAPIPASSSSSPRSSSPGQNSTSDSPESPPDDEFEEDSEDECLVKHPLPGAGRTPTLARPSTKFFDGINIDTLQKLYLPPLDFFKYNTGDTYIKQTWKNHKATIPQNKLLINKFPTYGGGIDTREIYRIIPDLSSSWWREDEDLYKWVEYPQAPMNDAHRARYNNGSGDKTKLPGQTLAYPISSLEVPSTTDQR
ncbi:hypothetical protein B0T20DRAFT_476966 [Sordaria brevicollis]|uniref:Uncharacterized protein n=1 Tax=Sordaria brevicollis TaxID=83679 RepID=A0AAE0PJA7_SORBR|nr:hypothetical protein B0T20DRAFT_476966 [Sordaria brevicollis]